MSLLEELKHLDELDDALAILRQRNSLSQTVLPPSLLKYITQKCRSSNVSQDLINAFHQFNNDHKANFLDPVFCVTGSSLISYRDSAFVFQRENELEWRYQLNQTFTDYECRFISVPAPTLLLSVFQCDARNALRFVLFFINNSSSLNQLDCSDVFFSGTDNDLDIIECRQKRAKSHVNDNREKKLNKTRLLFI
jgi:hypothetical protein